MHRSIMYAVLYLALMLTSGSSMRVFSSLCASGGSPILPLPSDESCKDGVCSLPTSKVGIIGSNEAPIYNNKGAGIAQQEKDLKIQQLVGMGWEEAAANRSLTAADFDVDKAAMMLDEEEKEREENEVLIKELSKMGNWTLEAAESAFLQSSKNITAASALLEHEEGIIAQNFDTAVKDMMANGWEELVARQALFTQWTLDQRKALGLNTTIDPEVLASIRPTLKIREDGKSSSASSSSSSSKKNKKAKEAPVKEAKREDCVFECKAQDFQRLVLDSDVPVLVDVYADWCGPCKQLGPVLENAAMKSGASKE